MTESRETLPGRLERVAGSPETPNEAGLRIVAGKPIVTADGATRIPLHGSYSLDDPDPMRRIVAIAIRDGSAFVYSAPMDVPDRPPERVEPPLPPDPDSLMTEENRLGGWINLEMHTDLRIPRTGGRYHVALHWGPLRSNVLTFDVPALPEPRTPKDGDKK